MCRLAVFDPVCSMNHFSVLNILFMSIISLQDRKRTISVFKNGKIEDLSWKKKSAHVLCQVATNPCYDLAAIFYSFISHLIGCETINIPEIFSGVHSFTGKTVKLCIYWKYLTSSPALHCLIISRVTVLPTSFPHSRSSSPRLSSSSSSSDLSFFSVL